MSFLRSRKRKINRRFNSFNTPIHYCCGHDEYRPSFGQIHFHNGFAYATNAHMAVKIPITQYGFTEIEAGHLEGKRLTVKQFLLLYKKEITITPEEIYLIGEDISLKLVPSHTDGKAPLPEMLDEIIKLPAERTALLEIGMNSKFIYQVGRALGTNQLHFYFIAANRAIYIKPNSSDYNGTGIVMPLMMNE